MNQESYEFERIALTEMFNLLLDHFGPQNWWPAETELEMMIGAVLTQNTNWKNVETAIQNLKNRGLISLEHLFSVAEADLAQEIRPAGYYNIKAGRLKNMIHFVMDQYNGDLSTLLDDEPQALRQGLLSVKGIGPETADSILLYAARRPVFVIDAYTHRILRRHRIVDDRASYHELQQIFTKSLPKNAEYFNEFHALIVQTGKNYCRKTPLCSHCPLEKWLSKTA